MSALEVLAYTADGARRSHTVRLPADPFDGRVHEIAMHEAVKTFLANQRQGTAKTKTRSFVTGGNQKPWRQKGTGRARQGSIRSPLWPGGGTMFGPLPREYRLGIPRKLRRLACRSALNARAREQALLVIEPLAFDAPKTGRMAGILKKMGLGGERVLVLTGEHKPNVVLSARNIPDVDVMRYQDATTYDILHAHHVVVEEPALGAALVSGAEVAAEAAPTRRAAKKAEVIEADAAPKKKAAKPAASRASARAVKKAPAKKTARPAAKGKARAKKPAAKKPAKKKKD